MSNFEKNITIEYLRRSADQMHQLKELTYQLLESNSPQTVLDIGCGPGIDTLAMAKRWPHCNEIIGVDLDQSMIDAANVAAKKEGLEKRVTHFKASAITLPFDSQQFDCIRAERLFQVISPQIALPQDIFDEAYRVLKPGGCMVLADTDWATASVNFSELALERRFVRFFADMCRPNAYAGRQFLQLMGDAQMKNIEIISIPIVMRQFNEHFPLAHWLVRELKTHNAATDTEIERWMDELSEKSERGQFLSVANMNVVFGIK